MTQRKKNKEVEEVENKKKIEKMKGIEKKHPPENHWLIDFNGMSMCKGLFNA